MPLLIVHWKEVKEAHGFKAGNLHKRMLNDGKILTLLDYEEVVSQKARDTEGEATVANPGQLKRSDSIYATYGQLFDKSDALILGDFHDRALMWCSNCIQ